MLEYSAEVEQQMKLFYDSLSEKDRRRYAAVEAAKLGHGGIEYIAQVLGCHQNTIRQGQNDVALLPEDAAKGRVRKKGADEKRPSTWCRFWKTISSKSSVIIRQAIRCKRMLSGRT